MSAITRMFGEKRRWREYRARVQGLPAAHRGAVDALERYFFTFGPGSTGRIQAMFDDLADLFEQSTVAGTAVRDVVGDDPVAFAEAFLANYRDDGWVVKERRRLVDAIDRAGGAS